MPGSLTLISTLIVLSLIAVSQASADLPAPPAIPDLMPTATPTPGSGEQHGSSGGSSSPPAATYVPVTPSPTPIPGYELEIRIPDTITVHDVQLSIREDVLYAPGGTALSEVLGNDTFEVVLPSYDNSTSKLTATIDLINTSAAAFQSVRLTSEKTLVLNGRQANVAINATLAGWPAGGCLDVILLEPAPLDTARINDQLGAYVDKEYEPDPLAVVDIKKSGLENGKDILDSCIIIKIERSGDIDRNATYGALRQSDGIYELLNATLLSGSNADQMVFEIRSPGGFSEFTLVKSKSSDAAQGSVPVPAAPAGATDTGPGMLFLLAMNFAAVAVIGYVFVKRKGY